MSTTGLFVAGLTFVGIGIPAWIFSIGIYKAVKRPRKDEPGARFFAYSRIMDRLHDDLRTGTVPNSVIWASGLRELRNFPEYRDLSLLWLEEVNITESGKFEDILKAELKAIESALLELRDD